MVKKKNSDLAGFQFSGVIRSKDKIHKHSHGDHLVQLIHHIGLQDFTQQWRFDLFNLLRVNI